MRYLTAATFVLMMSACCHAQQPPQPASRPSQISLSDKAKICELPKYPARVSPDGKWVVWLERKESTTTYHLFDVVNKTDKTLHSLPDYVSAEIIVVFINHGMWSADSTQFLVANECADKKKISETHTGTETYCDLAICDLEGNLTNIPRKSGGAPHGGVFGPDGLVYWSNVITYTENNYNNNSIFRGVVEKYEPERKSSSLFQRLPDYGINYLTISPDRSELGALTIKRTAASEQIERRMWVMKFTDKKTIKTSEPLMLAMSTLMYGRWVFWSPDGQTLYTNASHTQDRGPANGLYEFKPFASEPEKTTDDEQKQISLWITQLADEEYSVRLEAKRRLSENLYKANEQLQAASKSKDLEVAAQAKELLEQAKSGVRQLFSGSKMEIAGMFAPNNFSYFSQRSPGQLPLMIDRQGDMGVFIENGQLIVARIVDPNAPASKPATPTSKPASQKTESSTPTTNAATAE